MLLQLEKFMSQRGNHQLSQWRLMLKKIILVKSLKLLNQLRMCLREGQNGRGDLLFVKCMRHISEDMYVCVYY